MRSFLRVFSVILLVLWMGFIFYMSAQPAETSSEISGGVIEVIAEKFYPDFDTLGESEKAEVVASFQFFTRKSAHVAGFAILGFFAFLSVITYTKLWLTIRILLASIISLLFAASDEYHQRFVSGRSCELRDFLLDAAGALAAILLSLAFAAIIRPLRRKISFEKNIPVFNNVPLVKFDDTALDEEVNNPIPKEQNIIEAVEEAVIEERQAPIEDITECEEKPMEEKKEIKLSEEMEYAASVIGEAVIEVTKVCNKLTSGENAENTKELINLALGRNEVLKSEILRILNTENSFEEKQALILKEKRDAYDYFNSIIAQMC